MRWIAIGELLEQGTAEKVPKTLAHCMVAVKEKGHSSKEAWNICRSSLVKSKHLRPPYQRHGKVSDLQPTSKGMRSDRRHGQESDATKARDFRKMFRKLEPGVA